MVRNQGTGADVAIAIAVKLAVFRCALRIASNANFRYHRYQGCLAIKASCNLPSREDSPAVAQSGTTTLSFTACVNMSLRFVSALSFLWHHPFTSTRPPGKDSSCIMFCEDTEPGVEAAVSALRSPLLLNRRHRDQLRLIRRTCSQ